MCQSDNLTTRGKADVWNVRIYVSNSTSSPSRLALSRRISVTRCPDRHSRSSSCVHWLIALLRTIPRTVFRRLNGETATGRLAMVRRFRILSDCDFEDASSKSVLRLAFMVFLGFPTALCKSVSARITLRSLLIFCTGKRIVKNRSKYGSVSTNNKLYASS